ncbi:MAG: glycogen debranching protein GlgX [Acetobacteraceae bacterium]
MGLISPGAPEPPGLTPDARGANVAVVSAHAEAIVLCLFDHRGEREVARHLLPERTGDVFHGHIGGLAPGQRYGLRAYGPFAPAAGHRFNPAKLLVDPFARALDRPFAWHPSLAGARTDDPGAPETTDSAAFVPKAILTAPEAPQTSLASARTWGESVIYELHVRGFTRRHPDVPEALRGTFAGLAHPAALGHLRALGVTAVEIMPAAAWIDERHLVPLGLTNYWGYNPVAFLAPDPRLAPGGWAEVRAAIAALHGAGIEVILDVVLNHSGEGDALGPTISLRGLDNAAYYRLQPADPARYIDDAGCGNVLACDRPRVVQLAMAALRTWAAAGLDGFRFDLATTLARRGDGFDPNAPLLAAIAADPVLARLKLIAEPWDIGPGGYQLGRFPGPWGEWNDQARDQFRRFWRGEPGARGGLATALAGSAAALAAHRRPSRGINFITAHDGFTLADLVSFERKHNAANGEDNRDGTDANQSWNNGHEGPSEDPAVRAARGRDQRALLATLLFARGTPMLAMGAELGHSQGGNNNAYAQDNETAWLDWAAADHELAAFTARLLRLRGEIPALTADRFLTGTPPAGEALADVVWREAEGAEIAGDGWRAEWAVLVADLFTPESAPRAASRALIAANAGRGPLAFTLPEPRPGQGWRLRLDSSATDGAAETAGETVTTLPPRAVLLFTEVPATGTRRGPGDPAALARLATAAGIAPDWWDVGGTRHLVSPDTQRALLAAMGLPAGGRGEIAESLARLAAETKGRALPLAHVARAGEPFMLPLGPGAIAGGGWADLVLVTEAGTVSSLVQQGLDRQGAGGAFVRLPAMPAGRHRLHLAQRPEVSCALIVAPARGHVPADLAAGGRRFGLAAHLYTLRRAGDQGIGDFTALAQLSRLAAAEGATLIGLNPLHALFAGERERASPYHPSDRRFLDPIYLDLAALPEVAASPAARALLAAREREIAALAARSHIDYPAVWALKRAVLDAAFTDLPAEREEEFATFVAAGGEALEKFALFEALAEQYPGQAWTGWPELLRRPGPAAAAFGLAHQGRVDFALFLQYLADREFAAAARPLGLYRDLAVGCAPDGAEAWANPETLARGVSIGAPPDPFSAQGQIWCLPPPVPLALARAGYAPFASLLAANMRHAAALRIDHAMGLTRLFWVPEGAGAAEGAYVAYDLEAMLAEITLASARAGCLVVGEDLGTVPEGFRERLAEAGLFGTRVLWFERDGLRFRPPASYPAAAVACVSTHDLPPLAGWWKGADLVERETLGQLAHPAAETAARAAERAALLAALGNAGEILAEPVDAAALAGPVHGFVAASLAALVLAQADDLCGETEALNLPGTDRERPNWRRRLTLDTTAMIRGRLGQAILAALRRRRSGQPGD